MADDTLDLDALDPAVDPDVIRRLAKGNSKSPDLINAKTYLGKGPFDIGLPGGSDISVGAGPAPAPGVNVGSAGFGSQVFGGRPDPSTGRRIGGTSGSDILSQIVNALGLGSQGAEALSKMFGGGFGTESDMTGSDPAAFAQQRAGERQDFTGALSPFVSGNVPFPGIENIGNAGQGGMILDPANLGDSGVSTAAPGTAEAVGGSSGGFGAGDIASTIASLLPSILKETGVQMDPGVGFLLGPASQAVSLAPALSSSIAAGTIPYAQVVAAAIQMAMTLANDIQRGASPEQTTVDTLSAPDVYASAITSQVIDPALNPSKAWMTFPSRAAGTVGQEELALQALAGTLPYVQTQQQLQDLLGLFRNQVNYSGVGGYGEGAGALDIPGLAEMGGTTHGYPTQASDLGTPASLIQQAINALNPMLPTEGPAFDVAGAFNQGLLGGVRGSSPTEYFTNDPAALAAFQAYPGQFPGRIYLPGSQIGQMNESGYMPETVVNPGEAGYDMAAAGFPSLGSPSSAWMGLLGGGAAPAAPSAPALPASVPPVQPGTPLPDSYIDLLRRMSEGT